MQAAQFDQDALRLGKLKAARLRVRLPDGTLIDSGLADRLPPAIELDRLPEQETSATLLLALPLEHANGGNCLPSEGKPARPVRFRQDWREVQDLYGDDLQSMAVLEHALLIRLQSDENAEYLTCPVARVLRDAQGIWALDPLFIPPLLSFDAHPPLLEQLDNLMTQLAAKRSRLMGMRRESNQRMADFAVADVSLFWLLNALNTYQPVLADLLAHPGQHPEVVYRELVKLAGSLMTFSLEHDLSAIPGYRHEQPEAVFPPLFRLISSLLEASLPSRVIALELEHPNAQRWQAGEQLYEDMREVLSEPAPDRRVLTCYQRVLMLGFLGRYQTENDPERERLLAALNEQVEPYGANARAPLLRRAKGGNLRRWLATPWLHVALAAVLLVGLWLVLHRVLSETVVTLLPGQV